MGSAISWRAVLVILGLASLDGSASKLPVENFEGDNLGSPPKGWILGTSGTVSIVGAPLSSGKCVRLSKPSAAGSVSATRPFGPVDGKLVVEIRVRTEATTGQKLLPQIVGVDGTPAISIAVAGANLVAYDGATIRTVQTISAASWYLLRLEIDTEKSTYDLVVDGAKKLTGAGFRNPVTGLAALSCSIGPGNSGVVFFDDVNVFPMKIPEVTGTYLVHERFNGTSTGDRPEGWEFTGMDDQVEVQEIPFKADKSLRLRKSGSQGNALATKSFPAVSGKLSWEFKVRAGEVTGWKNIAYFYSESGALAASLAFSGNKLAVRNAASTTLLDTITPGVWVIVRVVLDTDTDTLDLYVDGIRKLTRASFRNAVTDISSFLCGIDESNEGTLLIDNIRAWTPASLIGAPPAPVFDVRDFGATGDGMTKDTVAIQAAIDACAGSGGSVLLREGTFLSGMIVLKSAMTFYIDSSATLLGATDDEDYPSQDLPYPTAIHVGTLRKALIYASGASNLHLDGGGTIDGNGLVSKWRLNGSGSEARRPIMIYPTGCNTMSVQNLHLKDAAVWCFVPSVTDYLAIRNLMIDSRAFGNRDGIDLCDTKHVLIEDCTIRTDDDAICPKSCVRSGLDDVLVRNCYIVGSERANGIKFGTGSYGAFRNMTFADIYQKNVKLSPMALESVDGADIENIAFRRIELHNTNSPFYLTIGTRRTTPSDDVRKMGKIDSVIFEDIIGRNLRSRIGCPISGTVLNGVEYPITNLTFRRCDITFLGGRTSVPAVPPEMGTQYPECTIWGDMPASGYFLRHVDNVVFASCTTNVSPSDVRQNRVLVDVTGLIDADAAGLGNLAITKIQYRPSAPTADERAAGFVEAAEFAFLEIMNVSAAPIDLDGTHFGAGIEFTFADTILAPGERALLVANRAAFEFRHGSKLRVIGVFEDGSGLSMVGERIALLDRNGDGIADFQYESAAPWPAPASNGGAIVLVRPGKNPVPGDPSNWRNSGSSDGAPGVDDSLSYTEWRHEAFAVGDAANEAVSGVAADPDDDGFANLVEYARDTNPNIPDMGAWPAVSMEEFDVGGVGRDYATARFDYRPSAEDVRLCVLSSNDLEFWLDDLVSLDMTYQGSNRVSTSHLFPAPIEEEPARFFRVHAIFSP